MHLELLIPGLCPPGGPAPSSVPAADARLPDAPVAEAPTLARWLSQAAREPSLPLDPAHWLWQRFTAPAPAAAAGDAPAPTGDGPGRPSGDLPVAPVTLALDGHPPGSRWWLRADPVHFVVGRTGLRLAPPGYLQLDAEESAALAASVRAHFHDLAADLLSPGPERWYLGADRPFALETTPPAEAAGADVDRHLPRGPGRRQWLGFVNEVQMLWFEHPVNRAREQRGAPVASGLWLHGAGRMPGPGQPDCDGAAGGGATLAALAALAGCPWIEAPEDAAGWLSRPPAGRWLVSLDTLLAPLQAGDAGGWHAALARLEADWFVPLDRALRGGRIASIQLRWPAGAGLGGARITASDRFRFWRRRRPLPLLLAAGEGGLHA